MRTVIISVALLLVSTPPARAQGTAADYARANALRAKYEALAVNVPGPAAWIGATSRFWYRKASKGTVEFIVFDAITRQRRLAFDHARLAAGLSKVTGTTYAAGTLPFQTITFADADQSLHATA